jgi:5-deoxy-glucuronate isomerase
MTDTAAGHVVALDRDAPIRADVTPARAGWAHLGFQVRHLRAGEGFVAESGGREVALVLLAGDADLAVGGERWSVGGRRTSSPGSRTPSTCRPTSARSVRATSDLELALGPRRPSRATRRG